MNKVRQIDDFTAREAKRLWQRMKAAEIKFQMKGNQPLAAHEEREAFSLLYAAKMFCHKCKDMQGYSYIDGLERHLKSIKASGQPVTIYSGLQNLEARHVVSKIKSRTNGVAPRLTLMGAMQNAFKQNNTFKQNNIASQSFSNKKSSKVHVPQGLTMFGAMDKAFAPNNSSGKKQIVKQQKDFLRGTPTIMGSANNLFSKKKKKGKPGVLF